MEIINFQSFFVIMSIDGKNIKTPIIANSIAIAVKIPNIIVGIKLEKLNIEKPSAIVIDVVKTAKPALRFVFFTDSIVVLFFLNSV